MRQTVSSWRLSSRLNAVRLDSFRLALPSYIGIALTNLLFAWLAYNVYETVHWVIAYYVPVPTTDYWRIAAGLRDYQSIHIAALWKQHNEHRIVFPELVFALDMLAAHGRFILPIVFSSACYALTWSVLSACVIGDREIPSSDRSLAVLLAGVVTFWQGSALFLSQPFLLQWPLMQLAVVLSLSCLKKAADTADKTYLAGAIAAAVVATYSSGNGLLLWPVLLTIGFFIRLPKRFMAVLGISAALFIGMYFIGYSFSQQTNLRALFLHPGYFMGFVGSYLSMPFGGIKSAGFGVGIGLTSLAIFVLLLAFARRFNISDTPPAVVLGGFYFFSLLTILITASGRMEVADSNFTTAKVTRYLSVPLLSWAALLLLVLWTSARLKWRILTARRLTMAFSLLLLLGFYKLKSWQQSHSQEFADYQLAAMSLDVGLLDSQIDTRLFPSPEFVASYLPGLKRNSLGLFDRDHEQWLGKNITKFGGVKIAIAAGEILYTYPVEHGVEVVGWADSVDTRDPFPLILLANEDGKIVGFGRQPSAGFPADLHTFRTPRLQSWVGFVNLSIPSRAISAYVVTRTGLLPINGAASLPPFQSASSDEVGPPVDDINWQKDPAWTRDRLPTHPTFGWKPSAPTYSSWSKRDENVGPAMAEFAAPANACVALPILHGPFIAGASAELVDADSGKILADLPFRDHDVLWTLWRVPLYSAVKRLRFVVRDDDRNGGQWLAVSAPLQCK